MGVSLKHDFEKNLGQQVFISIIINIFSVIDVFTKATCTTKERLVICMKLVKDASKSFETNYLIFVRSKRDTAYPL